LKRVGRLMEPIQTHRGFDVVEIVTDKNRLYAMVKVPVEDLPNLKVLKTDKERREYQRKVQRKYRQKLKKKRTI
jgi:hypothetical protein